MHYASDENSEVICYHFVEGASQKVCSITFGFLEEVPHFAIQGDGALSKVPILIPLGVLVAALTEAAGGPERVASLAEATFVRSGGQNGD